MSIKRRVICVVASLVSVVALGQGSVVFNNRVPGFEGKVYCVESGIGLGAGWTAQLFGGPEGGALAPLFPTTTFRTNSPATLGYVYPVDVIVQGVSPGARATLQMRVFDGPDFFSSLSSGTSSAFTLALGGGMFPPANLVGLQSFGVFCIPEPSTCLEVLLGGAALLFWQLRDRARQANERLDSSGL